jgi:hypothetical protein
MNTRPVGALLLPLLLISGLVLGANASLADHRSNRDYSRDNRDYPDNSRGLDRPERQSAPTQADHGRSTHNRDENRTYNSRSERHSRPDYADDRDVSINFIVGPSSPGYSYRSYPQSQPRTYYLNNGYPYSDFGYNRSRPQVIIERNTYIEQPTRRSNVITYRNRPATSLLRDLNGRCFERYIDSNGYETRTELPASACDF